MGGGTFKENLLERFVEAFEKISNEGLSIYLRSDDTTSSSKMAMDLAAMRIGDGLEEIARAINNIDLND